LKLIFTVAGQRQIFTGFPYLTPMEQLNIKASVLNFHPVKDVWQSIDQKKMRGDSPRLTPAFDSEPDIA
jgi:hypothetical protein